MPAPPCPGSTSLLGLPVGAAPASCAPHPGTERGPKPLWGPRCCGVCVPVRCRQGPACCWEEQRSGWSCFFFFGFGLVSEVEELEMRPLRSLPALLRGPACTPLPPSSWGASLLQSRDLDEASSLAQPGVELFHNTPGPCYFQTSSHPPDFSRPAFGHVRALLGVTPAASGPFSIHPIPRLAPLSCCRDRSQPQC